VVEIAVGIGGFAGIIAAIRQRSVEDWPLDQRVLLQMLLVASAVAATFALLPAVLADAGFSSPTMWRIASSLLLAWILGIAAYRVRQFRKLEIAPQFPRLLTIFVGFGTILQCLNLALASSWPYLVGVFVVLVNGFSYFLLLLFGRQEGPGTPV
jgi:hypothetical protein